MNTDGPTNYPVFPWVGGISTTMTPYDCFLGCLKIDMVEKETDLTIGISPVEGDSGKKICFCGHKFKSDSNFYEDFIIFHKILYNRLNY